MNDLVTRWLDDPRLRQQVLRRLLSGKELGSLVGSVDGRADLRGFIFPSPTFGNQVSVGGLDFRLSAEKVKVRSVVWEAMDFTGATLSHLMFIDCTLRDLKVQDAVQVGSGFWGCLLADSHFTSSDLRELCLSSDQDPSKWQNSTVEHCDLRDAVMWGGAFENVEFRAIKTNGLNVTLNNLVDVKFSGTVDRVHFDNRRHGNLQPRTHLGVDFSEATLREVDFSGWRFSDALLPKEFGWYPNQVATLRRVIEILEKTAPAESPATAIVLAVARGVIAGVDDDQIDGYFNPAEWRRYDKDGASLRLFDETLHAALSDLGLKLQWGSDSIS